MAAPIVRFRAAEGVLRVQLKWLAYAGALIPLAILAGTLEGVALGREPGLITELPLALAEIAIPIAVGIAVLRYRLYEIDRLINATLVYGALTALLALAFVAVVAGLGVALGGGRRGADGGGDARGRARVPAAARQGPARRRPPLQPLALRGTAARRRLPRGAARRPRRAGGDRRRAGGGDRRPEPRAVLLAPARRRPRRRRRRPGRGAAGVPVRAARPSGAASSSSAPSSTTPRSARARRCSTR